MNQNHTPANQSTPLQFPPIPLLSGDSFTAEDGTSRPIAAVTVTVQAEDGTARTVPLDFHFGGWWAPIA